MISAKDVPANARILTVSVDGKLVELRDGQTIYEVTDSCRREVPTLCYDPRLEAFGSCRLCVVEVEGIKNPVASCTTKATDGMVIKTRTNAIEQYRKTLLEMVASENRNLDIDPLSGYASQELGKLIERYEARTDRFCGKKAARPIRMIRTLSYYVITIIAFHATAA